MQYGDIASFERPSRACIFEGLLANKPSLTKRFFSRPDPEVDKSLKGWTANELPLKTLIDSTNRLGIHTIVFTLMGQEMEDPIYQWLLRKGVSCVVHGYESIEHFYEDFRYDRSLHNVYVADQDHAALLGLRATVVAQNSSWS